MNRELSPLERSVTEAMIKHGVDGDEIAPVLVTAADRARWLEAVEHLTVHRMCGCGLCPSIDFAYKGVPVEGGDRKVLAAGVEGQDSVMVLLFIDGGLPSYLEVVPPDDEPVTMPEAHTLSF